MQRPVRLAVALAVLLGSSLGFVRLESWPSVSHAAPLAGSTGTPGPTAPGRYVNPHLLPAATSGGPRSVDVPEQYPVSQSAFQQIKQQANAAAAKAVAAGHPSAGPASAGQLGTTVEFPALDFDGTGQAMNPPDGGFTTGPSSVLEAVNESWGIYSRSGSLQVGPVSYQSFFGFPSSSIIYDPRALYDTGNAQPGGYGGGQGRFVFVTVVHDSVADTASYELAVSQNNNPGSPTTGWCTYTLNAVTGSGSTAAYPDFTMLGMDGNYIYLSSNQYTFDPSYYFGGNFTFDRILAIPKSSIYPNVTTGACPTATSTDFQDLLNPDGTTSFTVQSANEPDAVPGGGTSTMYFVNAVWPSGSQIAVRSITASGGTLTLNAPSWVNVSFYDPPANAPQPNGGSIPTDDTRLRDAYYRYGTIYTTNSTQQVSNNPNANPYANVQWYQINPTALTATTNAITNLNVSYYIPGVVPGCTSTASPCPSPFVAIEVSGSGASQPASAFYLTGNGSPAVFQGGVAGYTMNTTWGDYPGASPDPTDPTSVWLMGQYARATNDWGTAITALSGGTGTTPTPTSTLTSTTPTPTATPTASYVSTVLADNPAMYYRLDEPSGTTAHDTSPNGHTATYTGNAILNQPGATDDGDAAISGNGQTLTYPGGAGLPLGSSARSVECWFKTSTSQSNVVLAAWGTETTNELFAIMVYSSSELKVTSWNTDYLFPLPAGDNAFDGNYHHYVATFDGSTLTAYYDGTSIGSAPASFNTVLNSSGLVLGSSTGGGYTYNGSTDEVAVYPSVLPASRVQAHYNAALNGATPTPTTTGTPVPSPTNTPAPTSTPTPTGTPHPTSTSTPVPTPTPTSTGTPAPTSTLTSTSTPTPTPTNTPVPTPTPTSTSSYKAAVLGDSPTAYYRLDEKSGSSAADSSGNGHTGIYNGSITFGVAGATTDGDTAVSLPGATSSYVKTPILSFPGSFTLEGWVNPANFLAAGQNVERIFSSSQSANNRLVYVPSVAGGSTAQKFVVRMGGTKDFATQKTYAANAWYYVVYTWNGTTQSIYVNGTLDTSGSSSATSATPSWGGTTYIGSDSGISFGIGPLKGTVDEIALYTKALSSSQVQNHYSSR